MSHQYRFKWIYTICSSSNSMRSYLYCKKTLVIVYMWKMKSHAYVYSWWIRQKYSQNICIFLWKAIIFRSFILLYFHIKKPYHIGKAYLIHQIYAYTPATSTCPLSIFSRSYLAAWAIWRFSSPISINDGLIPNSLSACMRDCRDARAWGHIGSGSVRISSVSIFVFLWYMSTLYHVYIILSKNCFFFVFLWISNCVLRIISVGTLHRIKKYLDTSKKRR